MNNEIYEIPDDVKTMFDEFVEGIDFYRIINYEDGMDMDNNQSMQHFLECISVADDNIVDDAGTQVIIQHKDYDFKLVIDSGGLGDFFSHKYEVSKL